MRRRPAFLLLGVLAAIALLVPAIASAQSKGSPQPKIVGGNSATISQYPWQAAVVFTGSGNAHQRQFCGGSLVTSRIVITAGGFGVGTGPPLGPFSGFGETPLFPHPFGPRGGGGPQKKPHHATIGLGGP